jgi:hypothetical protein
MLPAYLVRGMLKAEPDLLGRHLILGYRLRSRGEIPPMNLGKLECGGYPSAMDAKGRRVDEFCVKD